MPKYKGTVLVKDYFEFEFEADDFDLAKDHLDKLVADGGVSNYMDFLFYDSSIVGLNEQGE